jgi:hypothetical protein
VSQRTLWKVLALCVVLGPAAACQRSDGDDAPATKLAPVPREQVARHEPPEPRQVQRLKAEGQLGPGRGTLIIDLRPPQDGTLTEGAPLRVSARGRDLTFPESIRTQLDPDELPVRLPIVVSDGAADPAEIDLTYYWCSEGDSGSCHPVRVRLLVELDLSGSGDGGEAHFVHRPES